MELPLGIIIIPSPDSGANVAVEQSKDLDSKAPHLLQSPKNASLGFVRAPEKMRA